MVDYDEAGVGWVGPIPRRRATLEPVRLPARPAPRPPSHPAQAGYVEAAARVNGRHIEIGGRRLVYGLDGLQKE